MTSKHISSAAVLATLALAGCVVANTSDSTNADEQAATSAPSIKPGPLVNAEDSFRCDIEGVTVARTVKDVQDVVRFAARTKRSLKVTSSKRGSHSHNPLICPETGGLVLDVSELKTLSVDSARGIVTSGPGATLDEVFVAAAARGLNVEMMPDYTGISVAGAIATGAHGSTLRKASSVASLVTGMTVVDGRGELRVFTPTEIAAGAVHVGWAGVVVSVDLRVAPEFKLRYGDETWNDERLELEAENLVRAHDYARIHWWPEHQRYVLDYFDKVSVTTQGNGKNEGWQQSGALSAITGNLPSILMNNTGTEDIQCAISAVRSGFWLSSIAAVDTPDSSHPVGTSYQMLGGSCAPGTCAWDGATRVKTRSIEIAFPLVHLKEWMGDVRQILSKNRGCFPLLGIYLRFSAESPVALDLAQGHDTVMFEIHVLENIDPARFEASAAAYAEIQQMTVAKYTGRPHWGKNEAPTFVGVGPRAYEKWSDYEALRASVDPDGLFENAFWRNTAMGAVVAHAPSCAARRTCICASDSDCGDSRSCVAGFTFPDTRVCRKAEGTGCLRGYECASNNCSFFQCR